MAGHLCPAWTLLRILRLPLWGHQTCIISDFPTDLVIVGVNGVLRPSAEAVPWQCACTGLRDYPYRISREMQFLPHSDLPKVVTEASSAAGSQQPYQGKADPGKGMAGA